MHINDLRPESTLTEDPNLPSRITVHHPTLPIVKDQKVHHYTAAATITVSLHCREQPTELEFDTTEIEYIDFDAGTLLIEESRIKIQFAGSPTESILFNGLLTELERLTTQTQEQQSLWLRNRALENP